ncbi:MAG: hypothetical protein ACK4IT_08725 [Thioalkalivibrionaceae bacterium]
MRVVSTASQPETASSTLGLRLINPAHAREPGAGVHIIELRHRTADEVIPTLEAALRGQVRLVGDGTRLIVVGGDSGVASVRQLLTGIDRIPVSYRIDLRSGRQQQTHQGAFRSGESNHGGTLSPRIISTRERSDQNLSMRVTDGRAASFDAIETRTGELEFIIIREPTIDRRAARIDAKRPSEQAGLRLSLTPRGLGDGTLRLDIAVEDRRFIGATGIDTSGISSATSLTVRPGEWVEIASLNDRQDVQESSIGRTPHVRGTRARGGQVIEARIVQLSP